jgi:hypothetical protein
MPRTPIDYSKTVFYKIVCNDLSIKDCFIGHTTDFTKRKALHKSKCNLEGNCKFNLRVYAFIREHGSWENWSMIPIEEMKCVSVFEALRRERELIEINCCTLNCYIPTRTQQERNELNREADKIKRHEYYENNKYTPEYKEKQVQYLSENKTIIALRKKAYEEKHTDHLKEKRQEWMREHVDAKSEYDKEYRRTNAIKIHERRSEKVDCPKCGATVARWSVSNHLKTLKCQSVKDQ